MTDPWIQTSSGEAFDLLDPDPAVINIQDIAFALSNLCRFTGHVDFYSVAQHSCIVSDNLPADLRFVGLMHDATEAYIGDISAPLRLCLPAVRAIEDRIWQAIATRYRLPAEIPPVVKQVDTSLLLAERDQFMKEPPRDWGVDAAPWPITKIRTWNPGEAEYEFLQRFESLNHRRGC